MIGRAANILGHYVARLMLMELGLREAEMDALLAHLNLWLHGFLSSLQSFGSFLFFHFPPFSAPIKKRKENCDTPILPLLYDDLLLAFYVAIEILQANWTIGHAQASNLHSIVFFHHELLGYCRFICCLLCIPKIALIYFGMDGVVEQTWSYLLEE